jgi:cyclopropane fatty-acyl-phospholipid synthase-like methyltransferase
MKEQNEISREDKTLKDDWPPADGTLNDRGAYLKVEPHKLDQGLAGALTSFFKEELKEGETICDLGCGCHGYYTFHFLENGIDCSGFDGNPHTPEQTNNVCGVRDLSEDFDDVYDWILCLEVGEHIPRKYEETFINNLHKNNRRGIILSWAVVGQTEHAPEHVNTQNNDYVKNIFNDLGYASDLELENRLRNAAQSDWFKNTIMVFRKD